MKNPGIYEKYLNERLTIDLYNNVYKKLCLLLKRKPLMWEITFIFLIKIGVDSSNDRIVGASPKFLDVIIAKCKKIEYDQNLNCEYIINDTTYKRELIEILKLHDTLKFEIYANSDELTSKYIKCAFNIDNIKDYLEEDPSQIYPLLNDVVGLDEAKSLIEERIIKPSKHYEIYKKYNVQVGGGVLLYGLPGTGKTMFAKAIANELDAFFISIKSSDIKTKYYGETEKKIKEIFDEARKHKVSIIFFDEFEAIGVSRDKDGGEITASTVVPELLTQMQGFNDNKNIMMFIAATNRPWDIDSALLRPGRLDSMVYVDLPNEEARKIIIQNNLKNIFIENKYVEYIARQTDKYNSADIKNICDKLIRIIIEKEIKLEKEVKITKLDVENVLKVTNSSVSINDENKMIQFKNKYLNNRS